MNGRIEKGTTIIDYVLLSHDHKHKGCQHAWNEMKCYILTILGDILEIWVIEGKFPMRWYSFGFLCISKDISTHIFDTT